jgi:peptide/nickel transport system substrate-binding protein
MLLAVACTGAGESGEAQDSSGGGGDSTAAGGDGGGGAPAPAGTFVHAADDEPLSLDPAQAEPGEGGETMILQVYERLLEIDPNGPDLIPGLSTEVPDDENGLISDDGLTYTFPIREGVTFHDGTELTADDVKFSWDRAMEMDRRRARPGCSATASPRPRSPMTARSRSRCRSRARRSCGR